MQTPQMLPNDQQKPPYAPPHLTTRHIGTLLQQLGPAKADTSPGGNSGGDILQDALYGDDQ